MNAVNTFVVIVFALTYLGMLMGRVPRLQLDRTGIALVAAFALLIVNPAVAERAAQAIDVPTLVILASVMVVSGKLEMAGLYDQAAYTLARLPVSPRALLAVIIVVVGALSALLTNDVVVFALVPLLTQGLRARGLDPRPFLLAAAAAANAGSVATLIGNPQNVLIAQVGHLDFRAYLVLAAPIAAGALFITWAVFAMAHRQALAVTASATASEPPPKVTRADGLKGALALAAVFVAVLVAPRPAIYVGAIAAALLISRRTPTRALLAKIDWPTLLLFVGLFVVTDALAGTGLAAELLARVQANGVDPARPLVIIAMCLVGSNSIGNVPLVALLLAIWKPTDGAALPSLAIYSTLAGNLLVTGSIANLIVFERAAEIGAPLRFRDHARTGVPVTLLSMAWAWLWLWLAGPR